MGIEEKAKAYDEALEHFKAFKEKYYAKDTNLGDVIFDKTGEMQKDFESIFPQLRESEDERIRRTLVEYFGPSAQLDFIRGVPIQKIRDWLEKQKEQKPIPDWMPKFLDKLRSMKNYFDWDEHREFEGHILAIINWIAPDYFDRKEKEQKPAEKQDYSGLNDLERAIHRSFLIAGVENVPVTIIKETAKECLEQMNPAEWSEEDERIRKAILGFLNPEGGTMYSSNAELVEWCNWLKSIRPDSYKNCNSRWKPSEEHLSALLAVFNDPNNIGSQTCQLALTDLYEQLKKL